jgi:hypothetical protein
VLLLVRLLVRLLPPPPNRIHAYAAACMPWIVSEAGMLGFFYARRHPAAAAGGGYGIKDILRVQQQQPEGVRVPGGT